MSATINPNATVIPDEAEVWLLMATADNAINPKFIPETADADLEELGWLFTGLIEEKKGISLSPKIEMKEYDAFGHPRFRVKMRSGKLDTGFTALETNNDVIRKVILPGSKPTRIGIPRDIQVFVLYRYVDEATGLGAIAWCSLTKAPIELKAHSGFGDGELQTAELDIHHTTTASGDVFEVITTPAAATPDVKTITIGAGVTAFTVTVNGKTTESITAKTKTAVQAALRALSSVAALPAPGVTVDGPDGGPLAATFTGPVNVSATGAGGTVTI